MKAWTHLAVVAPESKHLFALWTEGGMCSGCCEKVIEVKALADGKTVRLAERGIPGIEYGTQFIASATIPRRDEKNGVPYSAHVCQRDGRQCHVSGDHRREEDK
jgi:hypothetical protein